MSACAGGGALEELLDHRDHPVDAVAVGYQAQGGVRQARRQRAVGEQRPNRRRGLSGIVGEQEMTTVGAVQSLGGAHAYSGSRSETNPATSTSSSRS